MLLHLSHLSVSSLFVLMALGPAVCHTAYTFGQAANVHCVVCCQSGSRPLAPGTPSIQGFLWKLLSDILLLPQVIEILWLKNTEPVPLYTSAGPDEVDVGVGQVKALDLGQGGSWVVGLGLCWDCLPSGGGWSLQMGSPAFFDFCWTRVCWSQSRPESED